MPVTVTATLFRIPTQKTCCSGGSRHLGICRKRLILIRKWATSLPHSRREWSNVLALRIQLNAQIEGWLEAKKFNRSPSSSDAIKDSY